MTFSLGLPAQTTGDFTLSLLQGHPERWPEKVVLKKDLPLENGRKAKKGKSLLIVAFDTRITAVDTQSGQSVWLTPEDCNFVEASNSEWNQLSPVQQSLDKETLADASIWPRVVNCTRALKTADGTLLPFGTECAFLDYSPEAGARIYCASENVVLRVGIRDTDFLFRARALILTPREQRPARIVETLAGKLEDSNGDKASNARIRDGKLFVLYFGASWSEPCRQFAPELVRFFDQVKTRYPGLVVVLLGRDKTERAMLDYMRTTRMPWPAISPVKVDSSPYLLAYSKGSVPQLVVVDRFGEILIDSVDPKRPTNTKALLWDLGMMLDAGKASP